MNCYTYQVSWKGKEKKAERLCKQCNDVFPLSPSVHQYIINITIILLPLHFPGFSASRHRLQNVLENKEELTAGRGSVCARMQLAPSTLFSLPRSPSTANSSSFPSSSFCPLSTSPCLLSSLPRTFTSPPPQRYAPHTHTCRQSFTPPTSLEQKGGRSGPPFRLEIQCYAETNWIRYDLKKKRERKYK